MKIRQRTEELAVQGPPKGIFQNLVVGAIFPHFPSRRY